MLQSAVGLSQPRCGKRQTQTPSNAMVYERFSTMSFAAKGKRLPHAICEPEFSTARLSFNTKGKEKCSIR